MPSPSLPDRRVAGALLLPLLASCNPVHLVAPPAKPATVSVQSYPVDLAFGTPPAPTTPAHPASQGPMLARMDAGLPPPLLPPAYPDYPPLPPTPPLSLATCPPPGPNTGADRQIAADVSGPVSGGSYSFVQSGTLTVDNLLTVKVSGLTTRSVSTPTSNGDGSYDFTETATIGVLRRQVVGFHVVPGKGVYLASLTVSYGGTTNSFKPVLPVEVFPLPARSPLPTVPTQPEQPLQFADAGIDPANDSSMLSQGTVSLAPERVNGCGESADGWHADATWSLRFGRAQQTYQLAYTLAPQYGGLVIADRIRTTDAFGASVISVDVSSRFGSLHPDPPGRKT